MNYILDPKITLKKWKKSRLGYTICGRHKLISLSEEEYSLLKQCDGETELSPNDSLRVFEAMRVINPCEKGKETLKPGQIQEYPNVQIMLSFDGIGTHDWLRQHKGSEEQVRNTITACKTAGLNVKINMNVNRRNRDVVFDSAKMLADLGVNEIRLIKTTEAPRWQLNAADDYKCAFFENGYYEKYLDVLKDWKNQNPM